MFVLDQSPTYEWPVKFKLPSETGSAMVECAFTGVFKRLGRDDMAALADKAGKETWDDARLASEVLAGWHDVADANGRQLPFTADNLASAMQIPGVGTAVCMSYNESQRKAAEKNS